MEFLRFFYVYFSPFTLVLTHLFCLLISITELNIAYFFNSQYRHLNEFVLLEALTSIIFRIVVFSYDIFWFCKPFGCSALNFYYTEYCQSN